MRYPLCVKHYNKYWEYNKIEICMVLAFTELATIG